MQQSVVQLNGSLTQAKSYLWAGALSLAWHQLKDQIIKEDIKVSTNNESVLKIVRNFNDCPFTKTDLSEESYYIRSGYGNQTVQLINKEVKEKFPKKSTPPLKPIADQAIISYAYFFKELKFEYPFGKKEVMFKKETTQGFSASTAAHRSQVLIHEYKNSENFIISLKTKSTKDEILFIKTEQKLTAEEVRNRVDNMKGKVCEMDAQDDFEMPIISLKQKRSVQELKQVFLSNKNFQSYYFDEMVEIIKLDINEEGVKIENQASISLCLCSAKRKLRSIKIDREFWMVMRELGKHPYFIGFINQLGKEKQMPCQIF